MPSPPTSGVYSIIRAAATFPANDTFVATTAITMDSYSNAIRLYVTVGVASVGNMEFYVTHKPPLNAATFDVCGAGDAPEVWGPLVFTGAGSKSLMLQGLDLLPKETVTVYFRASAGAASATVAIDALPTVSIGTNLDIATGDIEIAIGSSSGSDITAIKTAVEIMDDWDESDRAKVNPIVGQAGVAAGAGAVGVTVPRVTLASDDPAVAALTRAPLEVAATDTGAINVDTAIADEWELLSVTLNLSAAGTTNEDFTIEFDSNTAAAYDTVMYTLDLSTSSVTDLVLTPHDDGLRQFYKSGDELNIDWPNTEARTYGIIVSYRLV